MALFEPESFPPLPPGYTPPPGYTLSGVDTLTTLLEYVQNMITKALAEKRQERMEAEQRYAGLKAELARVNYMLEDLVEQMGGEARVSEELFISINLRSFMITHDPVTKEYILKCVKEE